MDTPTQLTLTEHQIATAETLEDASSRALFIDCCRNLIYSRTQFQSQTRRIPDISPAIAAEIFTYNELGDVGLGHRQLLTLTEGIYRPESLYTAIRSNIHEGKISHSAPSEVSRIESLLQSKKQAAKMVLGLMAVEDNCAVHELLPNALKDEEEAMKRRRGNGTDPRVSVYWRGPALGGRALRAV